MKNVLWLASWYPNKLDNFDGDFIQRHAGAVARYCKIHVMYVKKDDKLAAGEHVTEYKVSGNLTEQIIYYNSQKTGVKVLDKIISQQHYKKYFRNAVTNYISTSGKPDLVHVHVAMKAGVAALWIKKKWSIPFIVSEHWTAYLAKSDRRIEHHPFPFKNILSRVIKNISALTVVSDHLGKSIQQYFPAAQYQVIPNVVDTEIFYPAEKQTAEKIRFIHISTMGYQKNPEAILQALALLKDEFEFEILLYGTVTEIQEQLISELGIQEKVLLKGEVPQEELAKEMQQCDALILYSRFETFGCVLIEANACGIPVIVSELEVFHEIVEEGVNGVFAAGEDPRALAEKLKQVALQRTNFDKNIIATTTAEKYNYKKVGGQFFSLYKNITN